MRLVKSCDVGATLARGGLPLAVVCKQCGHRRLLTVRELRAHEFDERQLIRLPLLCRCGRKDIALYLMETPDDQPAFLAGEMPHHAPLP
jgi:hypothetical protein